MSRTLALLCSATAVGIGGTLWVMMRVGDRAHVPVPERSGTAATPAPAPANAHPLVAELRTARAMCDVAPLDAVVTKLREAARAATADPAVWRVLAEAHLERALARSHDRGVAVGTPTFAEPPAAFVDDVQAGLAAAARAREVGDDSAELFRIEAGLMTQRITGLATAVEWNSKIEDALAAAGQRERDNPRLHTALGLRRLLAPQFFGQDVEQALAHFEFAASAQTDDERPALYAGMATFLQQKRQQAIAWLERAVARNPKNRFARVVLARLRAGEQDPFGRDVTAAEAAATK